jgi:hypothetical protein
VGQSDPGSPQKSAAARHISRKRAHSGSRHAVAPPGRRTAAPKTLPLVSNKSPTKGFCVAFLLPQVQTARAGPDQMCHFPTTTRGYSRRARATSRRVKPGGECLWESLTNATLHDQCRIDLHLGRYCKAKTPGHLYARWAAVRVKRRRWVRLFSGICLARERGAIVSLSTIHPVIECSTRFRPLCLAR